MTLNDFLPLTGPVQEGLQPGSPVAAALQVTLQSTQDVRGELLNTSVHSTLQPKGLLYQSVKIKASYCFRHGGHVLCRFMQT